ncbi:MAG: hypothetical protein RJA70_503 [Pseudomonadota bacterium]|jgi:hypothetical protein
MKRPLPRRPLGYSILALLSALLGVATPPANASKDTEDRLLDFERPFAEGIRGITVGPIENTLHSDKGYGSDTSAQTFQLSRRLGANWVSLTPFGRAWNLTPSGVDLRFEAQFSENRRNVIAAIRQAHNQGLKVLLVPHLWVETGEWRALIHFDNDQEWKRWFEAYRVFLLTWAAVAQEANVDLFSAGVEWRSWVTTTHAPSFAKLLREVKRVYRGPITYAANWDDVEHTVILGELDVIGINAFYPLTDKEDASMDDLLRGGSELVARVERLALEWRKPVLFTEIGYTTRPDPALRPWEWPDSMQHVTVDGTAQAEAYFALLHRFLEEPWFLGFFVWRNYADPYDTSQEAPWGFSPLHKPAEIVMRDAFAQPFAYEGPPPIGHAFGNPRAQQIGRY